MNSSGNNVTELKKEIRSLTKKIEDLIVLCKACGIAEEMIFRTLQNNNSSKRIANQEARFIEEQARRREKSEFSPNRNVQMQLAEARWIEKEARRRAKSEFSPNRNAHMQLVLQRQKEEENRPRRQREEENRARRQRAQEKKMNYDRLIHSYEQGNMSENTFNNAMKSFFNYYGNE